MCGSSFFVRRSRSNIDTSAFASAVLLLHRYQATPSHQVVIRVVGQETPGEVTKASIADSGIISTRFQSASNHSWLPSTITVPYTTFTCLSLNPTRPYTFHRRKPIALLSRGLRLLRIARVMG